MADFNQITNAFVQQFDSGLMHAAQQSESRLLKTVMDKGTITGESFTHNGLGEAEMDEKLVRLEATHLSAIEHSTRVANMRDYFKAIALDRADIPKMLINPITGGDYVSALIKGRNRKIDELIFNALTANQLLKDGSTVALPATQKILAGGTAFTKAKVIQAKKLFRAAEADEHAGEDLFMLYDDSMMEDILTDTTLTSAEFMSGRMLQEGDVSRKFLGFNWIPYQHKNRTLSEATTVAYAKRAVKFGRAGEEGDVTKRPDLQNAWQVSLAGSYGALRTQEELVVSIAYTI